MSGFRLMLRRIETRSCDVASATPADSECRARERALTAECKWWLF